MNRILTIGGSDTSGGAGVQADIETINELGANTFNIITAVTAQSNENFYHSHPVPAKTLQAQLDSIDCSKIGAIKIGMLPNLGSVQIVKDFLMKTKPIKSVLDPVLKSTSGGPLSTQNGICSVISSLFSLATLITPNSMEAEFFTKITTSNKNDLIRQSQALLEMGPSAVLVKGGHLGTESSPDILAQKNKEVFVFDRKRIRQASNVRGTGCRLASAIAFYLASGIQIFESVEKGTEYLQGYLNTQAASKPKG